MYPALLSFSGTLAIKFICLNNQLCIARPMFIDLNPKNSLDDPSGRICFPNKTKDINLKIFSMKRINEAKKLIKYISCDCKFKFDGTKCNSNQ